MKKWTKVTGLTVSAALLVTAVGCGTANDDDDTAGADKVNIIITNGKGEIAAQWTKMAEAFMRANPNITVEAYSNEVGDTIGQFDKLTKSGKTVTVAMVEPSSVAAGGKYVDLAADLSGEAWTDLTESEFEVDGKVRGFPFAIEGFGIVFNRAVVEKAVGGAFDEKSIKTRDQLEALFKKVQASGIAKPVAYQTEAWSVANHYISQFVNQSDDPARVVKAVADGSLKLADNAQFKGLLDTMDLLKSPTYNVYGARPLGQYYDAAHVLVGNGKAAFLFNGNWAYDSLKAQAGADYGFIAVPVGNDAGNRVNGKLTAGPTQVLLVNKKASKAEQSAGKKFLQWLVDSDEGKKLLVTDAQVISAFSNNMLSVTNPLGKNLSSYIAAGAVVPFSTNYIVSGDYFNVIGPEVQKYIAGKLSRAELAAAIEKYHASKKK